MKPPRGPKPAERTCQTCKGSGMVERWYRNRRGLFVLVTMVCDDCQGTGTVAR